MKHLKYFLFLFVAALTLTACNSEDNDYDIEYAAIHPLGGQYTINVYRDGTLAANGVMCTVVNTAANDKDKCWVRIGKYNDKDKYCINGKIGCNVSALTFEGSNIENLAGNVASSTETFTLTGGKVTLKGITAPSGTVADKIEFTYTTTKDPGATYTVLGYRYTGWPVDVPSTK